MCISHSRAGTLLLCFLVSLGCEAAELPEPLQKLLQSRREIRSATIEWLSERPVRTPGHSYRFRSRYAASGNFIVTSLGDPNGYVLFNNGNPIDGTGEPVDRAPRDYFLDSDGSLYSRAAYSVQASWLRKPSPDQVGERMAYRAEFNLHYPDVRYLGVHYHIAHALTCGPAAIQDPFHNNSYEDPPAGTAVKWRSTTRGRLAIVEALTADGPSMTWEIDPRKNWNPERIWMRDSRSGETSEVVLSLRQFGQRWFPVAVEQRVRQGVLKRYTVVQAVFDEPNAPADFSIRDLGLEVGMEMHPLNDPPAEDFDGWFWDGQKLVDRKTIEAAYANGLEPGPLVRSLRQRGHTGSPYVSEEKKLQREQTLLMRRARAGVRSLRLWTKYTQDFIERHALTPEQAEQAHTLLKRCEQKGQEHFSRCNEQYEDLTRRIENESSIEAMAALRERLAGLNAPLDQIFEEELKPGLERLLTRAQRKQLQDAAP